MPTRKPILIAYYSLSGNTERVARDLATRLDADLEEIHERKSRRGFFGLLGAAFDSLRQKPAQLLDPMKDPRGYSLVVVGTPVWAGRITPAARTYLEWIRERAAGIACFTTSAGPGPETIASAIETLIAQKVVACTSFTQRDLRDAAAYGHKLDACVMAVKLRPMRRVDETGVTHAHA